LTKVTPQCLIGCSLNQNVTLENAMNFRFAVLLLTVCAMTFWGNFYFVLAMNAALWMYFIYDMHRSRKSPGNSGAIGAAIIVFAFLFVVTLVSLPVSLFLNWNALEMDWEHREKIFYLWHLVEHYLLR